jgi:hypothetical protein
MDPRLPFLASICKVGGGKGNLHWIGLCPVHRSFIAMSGCGPAAGKAPSQQQIWVSRCVFAPEYTTLNHVPRTRNAANGVKSISSQNFSEPLDRRLCDDTTFAGNFPQILHNEIVRLRCADRGQHESRFHRQLRCLSNAKRSRSKPKLIRKRNLQRNLFERGI